MVPEVLPQSLLMVEVSSSFRSSRPGRLNCVKESSLVVGQDGLGSIPKEETSSRRAS